VDALSGVVAVDLTSVPVAIVVLLTAVGAIAVVVHAIAGDFCREVGPRRIGVVAVGVFGLVVSVAIARVETVTVLIDPVADQLQPVPRDGGILRGTVCGVRVAIAIPVRRAAVVHAIAVLVHAIARRVVSPVRAVVVVIVAVQRSRGAIAVLVVGSRTYAAERVGNSTIVGLAGIWHGHGHGRRRDNLARVVRNLARILRRFGGRAPARRHGEADERPGTPDPRSHRDLLTTPSGVMSVVAPASRDCSASSGEGGFTDERIVLVDSLPSGIERWRWRQRFVSWVERGSGAAGWAVRR
jgi:hypothetical protein